MARTGRIASAPPDVVIVGAPKCGTTSLYGYLKDHPGVYASPIKEPNFFCLDTPALRVVDNWKDYGGLFRSARPGQLRLEASTAYLLSPVAVPAILEASPKARIIVTIRNPIDMIVSYHAQKLYAFEEDQPDFAVAWSLSEWRARGERVNDQCRAPAYLDYQRVARLGDQVARMVDVVPADQLLLLLFDNLSRDAAQVYGSVLEFLGLEPVGRKEFAVANARKRHAWPALSGLIVKPPGALRAAKRAARAAFPGLSKQAGAIVHRLLQRSSPRTAIAPDLHRRLVDELRPDIDKLARLLNRDLSAWTI
jgi:hypothetical protein